MSQFSFALSVKCPVCHVGRGHWCRHNGKCIPPHRERAQAALRIAGELLRPLSSDPRTRNLRREDSYPGREKRDTLKAENSSATA